MSRQSRPQPMVRFVYVIGPAQGLQKVGVATNPQSRLATLQTANPAGLVIHAAIAVPFSKAHAVEAGAHRKLAGARVRNEWFETTPAEAVAVVRAAAAPFVGQTTSSPDLAVVWPPASSWRIGAALEAAEGLPLFDYSRPLPAEPAEGSRQRRGWWSKLRRIEP